MRVILDTNVLVSYLLARQPGVAVRLIVDAALAGRYHLLLPTGVAEELQVVVAAKPYLSKRLPAEQVSRFLATLGAVAEVVLPTVAPDAPLVRDPKDDYLLAAARRGRADVLVTGDRDLLALAGAVAPPRILSPADFAAELAASG